MILLGGVQSAVFALCVDVDLVAGCLLGCSIFLCCDSLFVEFHILSIGNAWASKVILIALLGLGAI